MILHDVNSGLIVTGEDWLAKEIAREKRLSAWELDGRRAAQEDHQRHCDAEAVRSAHNENCDARALALEHERAHDARTRAAVAIQRAQAGAQRQARAQYHAVQQEQEDMKRSASKGASAFAVIMIGIIIMLMGILPFFSDVFFVFFPFIFVLLPAIIVIANNIKKKEK